MGCKDSIKYRMKRERIMMLTFGISGWMILLLLFVIGFFTDDIRLWKKEQKEMEINQEEVRQIAKKRLEDKYGESFIVKKEINEENKEHKEY